MARRKVAEKSQWLLLMHQLPPKPDSLRVRVWRSLQKIGAIPLKNSVYVLPVSEANESRFASMVEEIVLGKGDAFLSRSSFVSGVEDEALIREFNLDRAERYNQIAAEVRELQKLFRKRAPQENDLMAAEHSLGKLRRQLQEIAEIDFFASPDRGPAEKLLSGLVARVAGFRSGNSSRVEPSEKRNYAGKIWVTRKGVRGDRMASAWLITRFIDPKARFRFTGKSDYRPAKNEVRFDMFQAEFGHVGDKCTFEVLTESFGVRDKAVLAIAEIIHDLDLKDTKFQRPEASGIGMVLAGITRAEAVDESRIAKANDLFDELKLSLG
jgi:hypothetical protein